MAISDIELPFILADIPPKLIPFITDFNKFKYFLAEGGRGGAKSHTIGRIILYLGEVVGKPLNIVCGREIQNTIQESVYTLLCDLIEKYNLNYDIYAKEIVHRVTKTTIRFRGFREQGRFNVQGMEGVDILWIDEGQAITKSTLDSVIPTIIRNNNAKIFFSMNRFMRSDPVYDFCIVRKECLHVYITYLDNPHCSQSLIDEANECKKNNPEDYDHIWLGHPRESAEGYLFNFSKLAKTKIIEPFGDLFVRQSVMSVDFSGSGGDRCVASLLKRLSNVHWGLADQRIWQDKDTDVSIGKTIVLRSLWSPTVSIVDKGGMGYPMFCSLQKSIPDIQGFDGSGEAKLPNSGNQRADGYLITKDLVDNEWLILGKHDSTVKEMETIKLKYLANGKVFIQSKKDIRKETGKSPDCADSVMMGCYAIRNIIGKINAHSGTSTVTRVNKSARHKK